jgi:hypothetical protein
VLEGQERALAGRDLLSEKSQQRLAKEETVAKLTTVKAHVRMPDDVRECLLKTRKILIDAAAEIS